MLAVPEPEQVGMLPSPPSEASMESDAMEHDPPLWETRSVALHPTVSPPENAV